MKMRIAVIVLFSTLLLTGAVQAVSIEDVQTLDLETAQQIALANNPNLAAAAERVEQARQRIHQASALYWPSVDANGSVGYNRISARSADSFSQLYHVQQVDRTSENYEVALTASWVLFDGFSRKFTNLIAHYGHGASEQARQDARRLLLQSVAESYYGAQLALYNKTIAEADFSFNFQQEKEAKLSMEAGSGPLSAVLNFQVQMNSASTDRLLAERDYDLALYGLALLLGIESGRMPEQLTLATMEMVEKKNFWGIDSQELTSKALQYRPDLQEQKLALQRAESAIGAQKAAYYPVLSLSGGLSGSREDDAGFEERDFGSSVSVNMQYNLFHGRKDAANVAEARAAKREAARNLEQKKNMVQSEVLQAISKLEQARAQLVLQRTSVALVRKTRDLVKDGYQAGQESLARLNEAQRDLVRTKSRLALSLIGLYTNRHGLKTATGESLLPYMNGPNIGLEQF